MSEPNKNYDEIDLIELLQFLWSKKLKIVGVTLLSTLIAAAVVFSLPNLYRSKVVISGAGNIANDWRTGLSNDVDFALDVDKVSSIALLNSLNKSLNLSKEIQESVAVLNSQDFAEMFLKKNDLTAAVFAAKGWNQDLKTFKYSDEYYDVKNDSWEKQPQKYKVYKAYLDGLETKEVKGSQLVEISFKSYSPEKAKEIVELLVKDLDLYIKQQDIQKVGKEIANFEQKVNAISDLQLKAKIEQVIREKKESLLMIELAQEYAIKKITFAKVNDKAVSPKRPLIIFICGMLALLLSLVYFALIQAFSVSRDT